MHGALKRGIAIGIVSLALALGGQARAESAYIAQAKSSALVASPASPSQPVQLVPATSYVPRQTAYVPTPETTTQSVRSNNIASTLQIGSYNRVLHVQTGGQNYSNVGIFGGSNNDVSVYQGGRDYANVNLINLHGLNLTLVQPAGSAPINLLLAKLPNGSYVVKR